MYPDAPNFATLGVHSHADAHAGREVQGRMIQLLPTSAFSSRPYAFNRKQASRVYSAYMDSYMHAQHAQTTVTMSTRAKQHPARVRVAVTRCTNHVPVRIEGRCARF
eukprot:3757305-Pleurochrysis_carterae.AAC.2